jgi:hypothetical protein
MLTDQLRCLVVVLVLDLLGFCADERADLPGNYFFRLCDSENSRGRRLLNFGI